MTGAEMIAVERQRQIVIEGWTREHDDLHDHEELAHAAAAYATPHHARRQHDEDGPPVGWPWDDEWWKPSENRVLELVKAGALIAAEIDRRSRAANSQETPA